jgi:hypothetical protein
MMLNTVVSRFVRARDIAYQRQKQFPKATTRIAIHKGEGKGSYDIKMSWLARHWLFLRILFSSRNIISAGK